MILDFQFLKEKSAYIYAKNVYNLRPIIILFDRAILDNRAYLDNDDVFDNMLSKKGLNEIEIANSYDLVINFISLSSLRPDLYKNDKERVEDLNLAAKLDKKTSEAWMTSENMIIIKPTNDINEKYDRVYNEIINVIKDNKKVYEKESCHNYDTFNADDYKNIKNLKEVNIDEYLIQSNELCKIKKIEYKDNNAYFFRKLFKDANGNIFAFRNKSISENTFNYILENSSIKGSESYQRINYIDEDFNLIRVEYNENMKRTITLGDNSSCLVLKK